MTNRPYDYPPVTRRAMIPDVNGDLLPKPDIWLRTDFAVYWVDNGTLYHALLKLDGSPDWDTCGTVDFWFSTDQKDKVRKLAQAIIHTTN
jgi:hypothetical protein